MHKTRDKAAVAKILGLITVVLIVPILPMLFVGADWDRFLTDSATLIEQRSPVAVAFMIGVILAADIFLPVPSGPLATLAGAELGLLAAIAVVWCGLTVGASFGFILARRFGRPIIQRFAGDQTLAHLESTFSGRAEQMLLVTRALPLLAESAVLLAGTAGLSWRSFLIWTGLGNLVFAFTLAAIGHFASTNEMLTIAVTISIAIPLLATRWLTKTWRSNSSAN